MSWTSERARVASLSRSRSAADPELIAARQNLAYERLEFLIRKTLNASPLSRRQRVSLAELILDGGAA